VDYVLWQHQGVEAGALVDRVLVISLQLVKRDYMEYCEEYKKGVNDEGANVGECCESECHLLLILIDNICF